MQRLGLRADLLEAILTRAEEKVLSGSWEDGMLVPNYVEARRLLERAEQEGRAFQHKAERASNGIFMAELAIESIGEIKGPADPIAFAHGATSGLEGLLQDATKELALGNADGAAEVAARIQQRFGRDVKPATLAQPSQAPAILDGAELLLAAGANPSAKSKDGRTAADWARRRGMHDVAVRLEAQMATSSGH